MLTEVMKHYGLASDLHAAGYYETDHHRQLCREVHAAILGGRLVAIAGMVGCGKTALLQHLQADLARENKVLVSKSLAVDQERTTIATLIDALFYDLSPEANVKSPSRPRSASANCATCSVAAASRSRCSSMRPTTCIRKR
jgi:type II secretory pathway predicted ATPase ExeA